MVVSVPVLKNVILPLIRLVKIPVLMINGRDSVCQPFDAAQKPLYDLLGTPEQHKKLILHPGGHTIPRAYREQQHQAISDWYDTYLGPVNGFEQ